MKLAVFFFTHTLTGWCVRHLQVGCGQSEAGHGNEASAVRRGVCIVCRHLQLRSDRVQADARADCRPHQPSLDRLRRSRRQAQRL